MSVVTQAELETPRSAADMLTWALAAHHRFTATPQLRAIAREGRCFAKQIVQEALPMARFVHRYFSGNPDVMITHVIGNQSYDGKVDDGRTPRGPVSFIEVTDSTWDHNEALRMELLTRDGHAPALGRIEAAGARGRRTVLHGHAEMRDVGATPTLPLDRIREVLAAKAVKSYPDGTALVVHVDDVLQFHEPAHVAALRALAETELIPLLERREFRVLAIDGATHLGLCYDLC